MPCELTTVLAAIVERQAQQSARDIVDAIVDAVREFRGEEPPGDDMAPVALRVTA